MYLLHLEKYNSNPSCSMKSSLIPAKLHCLLPSLVLCNTYRSREPPVTPNNIPGYDESSRFANTPARQHSFVSPNSVLAALPWTCPEWPGFWVTVAKRGHRTEGRAFLSPCSNAHIINKRPFNCYVVPVSFLLAFLWFLFFLYSGSCGRDSNWLEWPQTQCQSAG